jgi:glycerophosphoryl diester phosphodiesterase
VVPAKGFAIFQHHIGRICEDAQVGTDSVQEESGMQVIAHRGASGYAPENTRAAFDKAIAMGAAAIETDVSVTADGALVLIHDQMIDRVSNGEGPVADHTLIELQALDFGAWRGAEFAGERIVTAEEMIDEYLDRIPVVFEIKDPRATKPLIELLQAKGKIDRVQITSFIWYPLLEARALDPGVEIGFLTRDFEPSLIDRIVRRGFTQICPHVSQLTAKRVALAREKGLKIRAWGIDSKLQIERLYETGVDGATINWPDWG